MEFQFLTASRIVFGPGTLEQLPALTAGLGVERPLLLLRGALQPAERPGDPAGQADRGRGGGPLPPGAAGR